MVGSRVDGLKLWTPTHGIRQVVSIRSINTKPQSGAAAWMTVFFLHTLCHTLGNKQVCTYARRHCPENYVCENMEKELRRSTTSENVQQVVAELVAGFIATYLAVQRETFEQLWLQPKLQFLESYTHQSIFKTLEVCTDLPTKIQKLKELASGIGIVIPNMKSSRYQQLFDELKDDVA